MMLNWEAFRGHCAFQSKNNCCQIWQTHTWTELRGGFMKTRHHKKKPKSIYCARVEMNACLYISAAPKKQTKKKPQRRINTEVKTVTHERMKNINCGSHPGCFPDTMSVSCLAKVFRFILVYLTWMLFDSPAESSVILWIGRKVT